MGYLNHQPTKDFLPGRGGPWTAGSGRQLAPTQNKKISRFTAADTGQQFHRASREDAYRVHPLPELIEAVRPWC